MNAPRQRACGHPLGQCGVFELVTMEDQVAKNPHDAELVGRVIERYTVLVEYYDGMQDPIKAYFLDKMQSAALNLARLREKNTADKYMAKLAGPGRTAARRVSRAPDDAYQRRQSSRASEYLLNLKLQKSRVEMGAQVDTVVGKFSAQATANTSAVKEQLGQQEESLMQKIRERRQTSLHKSFTRGRNLDISYSRTPELAKTGKDTPAAPLSILAELRGPRPVARTSADGQR